MGSQRRVRAATRALIGATVGVVFFLLWTAAATFAGSATDRLTDIYDPDAEPWNAYIFSGTAPMDEPGGRAYDYAYDVESRSNGVSYVCGVLGTDPASGTHYNASLMRLVDGVPAWATPRTFDSKSHGDDYALSLALGSGSSVFTAGESQRPGDEGDFHVIRWTNAGTAQWARRYNGPGHGADWATESIVDRRGNVVVAGPSTGLDGSLDWAVVSWTSAGTLRWVWRYAGTGHDEDIPYDITAASDGSVYVVGNVTQGGMGKAMAVRLSPTGTVKWRRVYAGIDGLGAEANALVPRSHGGVYVCGSTTLAGGSTDGLVMSYDGAGARTTFAADGYVAAATDEVLQDLVVTTNGRIVAVGSSKNGDNRSCHRAIYSAAGALLSQVTLASATSELGEADIDGFTAVDSDTVGGFVATGTHSSIVDKSEVIVERGSTVPGGGGFRSLWSPDRVPGINGGWAVDYQNGQVVVAGICMPSTDTLMDHAVLVYVY